MAEISRYPTVTSYSMSDQLITYQTSSGQLVKIPISVFSEALAQTFTALTDTPGTYLGQQGKTLAVNNTEDALEFVPNNLAPNFITLPDTPGSYGTAAGKTLRVNGAENAVEFVDSTFLNDTDTPASYAGNSDKLLKVNAAETGIEFASEVAADSVVYVTEASELAGTLDSSKVYWIDGIIDFTGTGFNIEVPAGGLNLSGWSFNTSAIVCSDDNYTLFSSALGGAGDLIGKDFSIDVSGVNSKVYSLTSALGSEAIELQGVNYNNCSSLGEITNYRQMLESETGRFGGSPELTFSGVWNGARISTSIVRNLDNGTTLFKEGAGLSFSGRFITDINCDLPTTGALLDFQASNIVNDESLLIQGAFLTRNGAVDASDAGITPNIDETSVKSNWDSNTGLGNTQKYIKGECTAETVTTVGLANTYYPLEGTITIPESVQFDSPANGHFRLLTGNGRYQITGDVTLVSAANNQVDIRVTKSTDGGSTFPTEINHIGRQVNNLSGARDVAFMPINFIANLKKNDIIRLEVENKTGANNITMENGSYLIITEV